MSNKHLLEVYDLAYNKLGILTDNHSTTAKSIEENHKINGVSTLSFTIPLDSPKMKYIINENLVRYKDEYYFIKTPQITHNITSKSITVQCSHLSSGLEGILCPPFDMVGLSARELMEGVLQSTECGWTVGTVDVSETMLRSLTVDTQSVFSNLTKIAETYDAILTFNSRSRTIDISTSKKNRQIVIRDKKNLQGIDISYDTTEMITRLTPYGAEDETGEQINIMSVNPTGKSYLEDYSYYTAQGYAQSYIDAHPELFLRHSIWEASDYVSEQALYDDALKKMQTISQPKVVCRVTGLDLSELPQYFVESPVIGEIVYIINDELNLVLEARVSEIKRNSDKPFNLEITITNELEFSSVIKDLIESSSKVEKVIAPNGEIKGQFIKELTIDEAQIKNGSITNAKIRDASIDSAKIGEAQIKSAHIDRAQIETGHIKDAQITSAKIQDAQIKSAHIDIAQIRAGHIDVAQIESAHIKDAQIKTAHIANAQIESAHIKDAQIKSAHIDVAQIETAHIKDAQITSAKIGEAQIVTAHIGEGQITTAKIGNAQIKTAHIDDAQITGAKIANATIETGNIKDAQITSAKIAEAQIKSAHIDDAQIKNAHIENGAIDNAKIADATIENAKIKSLSAEKITAGTIGAERIGAQSITANHLSPDVGATLDISANTAISIKASKDELISWINVTPEEITIQANRIGILGEANIGNAIIGNAHIKDGAIDSAKIREAQILTAHIGEAQITNAKIASGAIGTANIQLGAITTALIEDGAIQEAQIADASITTAKIVSLTADKIVGNTLDTSKVTIQGANGKIRLVNNRLQVFDNQATPKERVSIGDVNGDGTVYGFRLRGADGTTILMDENGVKKEGITDGSITNEKISDDADIEGSKLLDNSVDGTKIVADSITAREIKAKSITGNEIVANSITAGELATGTITAESGVIGSLDASKITTGTMSANYIQGGTLDVGGNNNGNGQITVLDSTGTVISKLDNAGITMNKGAITGAKMQIDVTTGKMILGTNNVSASSGYALKFDGTNLLLGAGTITWDNLSEDTRDAISQASSISLPSWLDDWSTGVTTINGASVITPRIFAGTNTGTSIAPNLTGLALGKDVVNGTETTIGMVLYKNNNPVFQLKDDGSVIIGQDGKDQITLDANGNAVLPNIRTNQIIVTGGSTLDDKISGWDNQVVARKIMHIDNKTDYLFHFDKDLCSTNGLHPDSGYQLELQESSGKYSGAIQLSPSTVNLVGNAQLIVYNNYLSSGAITTTREQLTNETFFNQPIHRVSYTIANEAGLTSMTGAIGKGIYINTNNVLTFLADTRYACSIYWRPVNKSDVSVSGTPSNIGNMIDGGTVYVGNGWYRTTSYRDGSVTTDKTDNIFFGFKCLSAVVGETVMIDWCCPQIEQGRSVATRYVFDNHTADNLTYTLPNELSNFTVCFWAKNVKYGLGLSKLFMGFANTDKSRFINIHNGWGNDWYLGNEISYTANPLTNFNPINNANYYFIFTRSSAVCTLSIYNESGALVYSTAKTIDDFTYNIKHISIGKGFGNVSTSSCYIDEVYITPRIASTTEQLALANLTEPLSDLNSGVAPPTPSSVQITIS